MKNCFIKLLTIALCLATLICFMSCQQESEDTSEYTITFYENKGIYFFNNGGEEHISIKYQDNTVYKVEKVTGEYPSEPAPPTNEGYVFLGWYQNPECTAEFSFGHYKINSDINLYAKWGRGKQF